MSKIENKIRASGPPIDVDDFLARIKKDMTRKKLTDVVESTDVASNMVVNGPRLPSGSLYLDYLLGGGYLEGRMYQFRGKESSGKTTHCINAIREAQKVGIQCVLIDAEQAFIPKYAADLGVDIDRLVTSAPSAGEDCLEMIEASIDAGARLIVVDSVANIVPRKELEEGYDKTTVGVQARLMAKAMRKLTSKVAKSRAIVIWTNQFRDNISSMGRGPTEKATGGNALPYYCAAIVKCYTTKSWAADPTKVEGGEDESMSQRFTVFAEKNKTANPNRKGEIHIVYGKGVDTYQEVLDMGQTYGLIQRKGAWYQYGEAKGQGAEGFKTLMRKDRDMFVNMYNEVRNAMLDYIGAIVDPDKIKEAPPPNIPTDDEIADILERGDWDTPLNNEEDDQ